ncbi:MAG: WG repeat-containing protein, partial [Saprospiraceae bacterium]|nr:WG repeat-containing protein [Saprospiraceae bacterium]
MNQRPFLLLAALGLAISTLPAQTLIPWLGANGKYGYATEDGRVAIQPKFDNPGGLIAPNDVSARAIQNGDRVTVFRNGAVLSGVLMVAKAELLVKSKPPKILNNLAVADLGEKVVLLNTANGARKEYVHPRKSIRPNWFRIFNEYNAYNPDQYLSNAKFQYGVHQVFSDPGRTNFVDTALNEIFSRDFPAAAIACDGFFLLADNNRKMGVGDRSGAIRIPMVWNQLEAAKRDGFFIANLDKDQPDSRKYKSCVGLLNAEGRLVIDTIHQSIYAFSENYLLVADKEKIGVMDYSGKWVLPQEFVSISYLYGDFFRVEYAGNKFNVVNGKGEKQFARDYQIILPVYISATKPWYLECIAQDNRSSLADSSFQLIFTDTLTRIINDIKLIDTSLVHFRVNDGGNNYYNVDRRGVRDVRGRSIVPGRFHAVERLQNLVADLYLVRKDSLYGVYNTAGRLVLPVEYMQVIGDLEEPMIWARRQGDALFTCFDTEGKALSKPPTAIPFAGRGTLWGREGKQGQQGTVVLINGVRIPDTSVQQYLRWPQAPVGNGTGFLFNDFVDPVQIVNEQFQPVVPEGYTVPRSQFYMPGLGTGLLPVYQMTASGQVASCGVVDTRGEWVLPPKKGVNYAPLSAVMVAELPAKYRLTETMASPENFKVLRLGGDKEPITANVVGHRLFTDHNNFTMLIGDTGKNGRFAYYNASGEQLTDNNLLNGGRHLERLNIVTIRDKKGGVLDVVID